jgi:hypothetical protein
MKRVISFLIILSVMLYASSCEKNPLWVGQSEFLTFEYSNYIAGGMPTISDLPISKSPFIEVGGAEAMSIGANTVKIKLNGIQVQTRFKNFDISEIKVYERDYIEGGKFKEQSEFDNTFKSNNDVALVLALDMSTSLASLTNNVKQYASNFVDEVFSKSDSSIISVLFFSGRTSIYQTQFYTRDNSAELKNEINSYSNSDSRTALFDATFWAINSLTATSFEGSKAVVVFTDGGDNDSADPTLTLNKIEDSEILRFCIGLKGEDLNKDDLKAIASSKKNYVLAKESDDLEKVFDEVSEMLSNVYSVSYFRSNQSTSSIEIKFKFFVDKAD